ncbi:DUF1749 domain-containing protein [Thiosulfativibrio zosterae]|uniref:Alpha/beta hydrolase n=1 Tax=Thiosulfativibrio zosterae TaxID=2675053 RepID=A0A6F8PLG5_9GAMM|nr:DUF1749 domain-containing protein [Thiosulfativibrio zosterae]BBP42942.1 hypothetical protein THMIRHAT_06880 [Thiosulfativibrio zosterae]
MALFTNIQTKFSSILIFCAAILFSTSSVAETVSIPVTKTLHAQAEFVSGASDIAVLINHGFLTTNKFSTVQSLINAIKDQGHSVLSPNLTLGINMREQSLKCNSLHTHTLEEDVTEINAWVDWLIAKGYQKIVLLGHSSGSQELLLSQITHPKPEVKLAIFTSLFYLNGKDLGTLDSDLALAKKLIDTNQTTPQKFSFLFCQKNYLATPESFLSYHKLTRQQNLDYLNAITIPSYTIMGSADKRYQKVGENWLDELKATKTHLEVIEGANHFFSSEHEFDLQDKINEIINTLNN